MKMGIFSSTIKDYTSTVGVRNAIDDALSLPIFVQTLLGHQVLDPKWSWRNKILPHFLAMSLSVYVIFGTVDFIQHTNDVTLKTEGCYTLFLTCTIPVKYFLYTHYRGTFRNVYVIAKTILYDMVKEDTEVQSKNVLKKINTFVNILVGSLLFPVLIYLANALWNYVLGNRITMSKTTSILMPMTAPFHEIGLTLHTIFMLELGFTSLVVDMWFVFLVFFFCVASDSLVNMLKIESRSRVETEAEYAERLNKTLRKFYNEHRQLMEYLNTLNEMYKWPTVIPLLNNFTAVCVFLFSLSEWKFVSNMLPAFVECFAYNWFGDQIKAKAMLLNMAILDFDWTSMRLSDRKSYLIIICYMNKEFCIKTALGNDLSLFTMSAVCKAGYQALTVLRSMEN